MIVGSRPWRLFRPISMSRSPFYRPHADLDSALVRAAAGGYSSRVVRVGRHRPTSPGSSNGRLLSRIGTGKAPDTKDTCDGARQRGSPMPRPTLGHPSRRRPHRRHPSTLRQARLPQPSSSQAEQGARHDPHHRILPDRLPGRHRRHPRGGVHLSLLSSSSSAGPRRPVGTWSTATRARANRPPPPRSSPRRSFSKPPSRTPPPPRRSST